MATVGHAQALSPDVIEAARAKMREKFGGDIGKKLGGKGTARRKVKKIHKSVVGEEKKLGQAVKRLGASDIQGIEEVQLFQDDGNVMSFKNPKVQAAPAANTYVITGDHVTKDAGEATPGDTIKALLQKLKEDPEMMKKACEDPEFKKQVEMLDQSNFMSKLNPSAPEGKAADDDIPDLVQNFEDVSKQ